MKQTLCVLLSVIFVALIPIKISAADETFTEVTVYENIPNETATEENPSVLTESDTPSESTYAETETPTPSTPEFFTLPLADNETPDGFVYEFIEENSENDNDSCIRITSYKGSLINLEIPSQINGHKVTAVTDYAFYRNYILASVSVPDTVTSIGHDAFAECENLVKITLPSELKRIGANAFRDCRMLLSFTLPENLEIIGDEAFQNCLMMRKLKIPATVTYIGKDAFIGCENLSFDCSENSYAQIYAEANHIQLSDDTTSTVNLIIIIGILLLALALYITYRILKSKKANKKN